MRLSLDELYQVLCALKDKIETRLRLDELYQVLYALKDKIYSLEDNIDNKVKIDYLKSIAKKVENAINNFE